MTRQTADGVDQVTEKSTGENIDRKSPEYRAGYQSGRNAKIKAQTRAQSDYPHLKAKVIELEYVIAFYKEIVTDAVIIRHQLALSPST